MKAQPGTSRAKFLQGRGFALALAILALPLLLGAWSITSEKTINPRYVGRIEDGKTTKSEILTLFGDPQETKHMPEGVVFVYKTFRTKERTRPSKVSEPNVSTSVDSPYSLEQNLKRKPKEGPIKELSSTLTIFFGPDGETVRSHEFK